MDPPLTAYDLYEISAGSGHEPSEVQEVFSRPHRSETQKRHWEKVLESRLSRGSLLKENAPPKQSESEYNEEIASIAYSVYCSPSSLSYTQLAERLGLTVYKVQKTIARLACVALEEMDSQCAAFFRSLCRPELCDETETALRPHLFVRCLVEKR